MSINSSTVKIYNGEEIEVCRIDNDSNGNPRYVFHFLTLSDDYGRSCWIANKFGGRKYTAKWYGGGIVLQSYNIQAELSKIVEYSKGVE